MIDLLKKSLAILVALVVLVSCEGTKNTKENETQIEEAVNAVKSNFFGEEINGENALDAAQFITDNKENDSIKIKLSGEITSVCQMKGCWMTMNVGEEELRITFKDYGFFVPKNSSGNDAVIEGSLYKKLVDVETLKHYAEDAGKSEEEINAITEPKEQFVFEASGLVIYGDDLESLEASPSQDQK